MKASEHFENLRRTDVEFAYESWRQSEADNEELRKALLDIATALKAYRQVEGWDGLTTAERDCVEVYQRALRALEITESNDVA